MASLGSLGGIAMPLIVGAPAVGFDCVPTLIAAAICGAVMTVASLV